MSWPLLDDYKRNLRDSVRTVFRVEPGDGDLGFIPIEKIAAMHYGTPLYVVPSNYYPREGLMLLFVRGFSGRKTFVRYERNEEGYLDEVELGSSLLDLTRAGVDLDKLLETIVFLVEERAITEYTNTGAEILYIPRVNISLPYSLVLKHPEEYQYSTINELFWEGDPEVCVLKDYAATMHGRLREAGYHDAVLDREAFVTDLRSKLEEVGGTPYRVKVFWKTEIAKHTSDVLVPAFLAFLVELGISLESKKHVFNVNKVKRNRRLEFDIVLAEG